MARPMVPALPATINDTASFLEFIGTPAATEYVKTLTAAHKELQKQADRVSSVWSQMLFVAAVGGAVAIAFTTTTGAYAALAAAVLVLAKRTLSGTAPEAQRGICERL